MTNPIPSFYNLNFPHEDDKFIPLVSPLPVIWEYPESDDEVEEINKTGPIPGKNMINYN